MHPSVFKAHMQQSNRGSALITIIVSMVFIIALGAALLFAAYTGYSIQLTQRGDKTNFYSADSAMSDIRLGLQTLLSDSIATAYTDVMTDYLDAHESDYNPQTAFGDGIIAQLAAKKTASSSQAYFVSAVSGGKTVLSGYRANALSGFISAASRTYATVTGTGTVESSYSDGVLQSVTLKGVSVQYLKNGYESNITSDITVTMPYFFAGSALSAGVDNYAVIANNALFHSLGVGSGFVDGSITVDGSVFAGSGGLRLSGNGYALALKNGDFVCKGPLAVDQSAVFGFNANANELWTAGITVGDGGTLTLDGKIHVADDLAINGSGATVTLKNSYFGFGNNTTASEGSSAILVNGRNSTLKINDLSKLSLAGISFIDLAGEDLYNTGGSAFGTDLPMGQSMSVRTDQLAYLVPVKCISNYGTNPCVFTSSENMVPDIDTSVVLWGTGSSEKTLSNYIGTGKGEIKTLYKPLDGSTRIAYVFLVFSDKDAANTYFKDYFEADPSKIEQYLNLYLTLTSRAADATVNAVGNTYNLDDNGTASEDDDLLTIDPAGDGVWADGEQLLYNRMLSPYGAFVRTTNTAAISNAVLEFKDSANRTVAVVSTAADYNYSAASPDTLRLIVSTQNVTVSDNFTGLIVAGGDVILNCSVSSTPLDADILDAVCTYNGVRYKLSDFVNAAQFGDGSSDQADPWDLDALVSYENWRKH